jgi:hypothetical protein
MPKVFISATSRDLRSYREVVAKWARNNGYEPVVQDEFPVQSDYGTILQMVREKLDSCDAVIHLAGFFYGFEPTNRPEGENRRSYTQLEYELAKEHKRQVFRFIAKEGFQADQTLEEIKQQLLEEISGLTPEQFEQHCQLQIKHRQRLMQGNESWSATSRTTGNELYYEFSNQAELQSLLANIEIKSTLTKPQNLPLVGSLFKGRDEFLEQLRSVLTRKPTHIAAITAKQAIHGLGGVGKTRVAVEYARRYSHDYIALLFITADSPGSLQTSLANLCGALVLNLPERDAREQEVQVAAALRWLREHSGWFLIIDNVDSSDAAEAVEELLQQLHTGHTVVTSRLSQWGEAVESLSLDVINEAAAIEFLMEKTQGKRKPTTTDPEDAKRLASDLGCLPLALEQAGAFVAKHRGSLQEYRARWKEQEQKVIEWHDNRSMKYPASVATTWETSFEQLTADGRELLNVLCWLAHDPIPLTMILKLNSVGEQPQIDVESGVADLAEYSLLKWTSVEHDFFQVHQLVQEITRYRLHGTEPTKLLQRAMRMANEFVPSDLAPDDIRSWPTIYGPGEKHFALLIQHAEQLVNNGLGTGSTQTDLSELTTRLMNNLAVYLFARASPEEAEPLLQRALAIDEQAYGPDHPNVAIRLSNLALLLKATNRLGEAEPLMLRALAIGEQSYGSEHPNVAIRLNNLAQLLKVTNRLKEAEPLMLRALAIDERSYGPEHPNVARDLNNLAQLLQVTNRLGEAEALMRRALAIDEQAYGPEHPNVARNVNNLAQLLKATNHLGEAEPLMRRALAINERSYGPEHPDVAISLNNLAQLLQATNRLGEAEPLMRRALAIDERSYGPEHPDVARDLNNLAQLLQATNRLGEAEPLMRRALAIEEQAYGPEHPAVAVSLNNLAQLLLATSRLGEAEPLMRRALAINERSYGPEHPDVAISLNNLAQLLQATNRLGEAEPLMRRALAIDERSYGPEHPDVARDLNNLAQLLQATNRLGEAEPLILRSVEILTAFQHTTGHLHPHLQAVLANCLELLAATGMSPEEAISKIRGILRGDR